jgi:hypothetical protein
MPDELTPTDVSTVSEPAVTTTPEPPGLVSKYQVEALNALRPKPALVMTYTPEGSVMQEILSADAHEKNANIDREVETITTRLKERQVQTRDAFKMAHDYGIDT